MKVGSEVDVKNAGDRLGEGGGRVKEKVGGGTVNVYLHGNALVWGRHSKH